MQSLVTDWRTDAKWWQNIIGNGKYNSESETHKECYENFFYVIWIAAVAFLKTFEYSRYFVWHTKRNGFNFIA